MGGLVSKTGASEVDHDDTIKKEIENFLVQFTNYILQDENIPKNVLLVGLPSAGKSSLINLLKSSLVNKYVEVARPGAIEYGEFSQFTQRLTRYVNMGLTPTEVENLITTMRRSGINIHQKFRLPTLIDIPGIENDSELVLDFVLDGLIPEHTDLCSPMSLDCSPVRNFAHQMENCIDHIIFVTSLKQDVPEKLMKTVFSLGSRKKDIPFSLIMTHKDCSEIPASTSKERRKLIESILCISKDSRGVAHCLANYNLNDLEDPDRPQAYLEDLRKKKDALIAMLNVVRPRQPRRPCRSRSAWEIQQQIIFGRLQIFARRITRFSEGNGLHINSLVFAVVILILAYLLFTNTLVFGAVVTLILAVILRK